ncbi:MAG: hypothetical protein ACREVN_02405 [Gammaproteobacteria bacterium]
MNVVARQAVTGAKPLNRCEGFFLNPLPAFEIRLSAGEGDQKLPDRRGQGSAAFSRADTGTTVHFLLNRDCDIFHWHSLADLLP